MSIDLNEIKWKQLYPNNMTQNGVDGYYCLMFYKHRDGIISARKYTILFQHEEIEPGTGYVNCNVIDRYVLFEKSYYDIKGPLEYPEPTEEFCGFAKDDNRTFNACDVNDYGNFVYAYETIEMAKKRAATQFNHIYGYVMSFLQN